MGLWVVIGFYIYIYIYYLIKYCQAGGYPPNQNFKNRYPSIIRIFKISISVSVRIYVSGRAGRWAGRLDWLGGSGSTVFCPPLILTGYGFVGFGVCATKIANGWYRVQGVCEIEWSSLLSKTRTEWGFAQLLVHGYLCDALNKKWQCAT